MAHVQVVGLFDDPAAAARARSALIDARLADEGTMWIEPEYLNQDLHPPPPEPGLWQRLKEFIPGDDGDDTAARGRRVLLVVTTPEELSAEVQDIMRGGRDVEHFTPRQVVQLRTESDQREVLRSNAGAARELG
jgi:hypothetical protein